MNLILLWTGGLLVAVGAVLVPRLTGRPTTASGDLDAGSRRLVFWCTGLVTPGS